jgi:hypothetical protein
MGRNARRKKERREERRRVLNENWAYFTSGRFLGEVQRLIRDSGVRLESSVACTKVLKEIGDELMLDIQPVSVEVTVYNAVFADYIAEHGLNPSDEDMHRLGEEGGRYVVLGPRDKKNDEENWHGYVVALMKAKDKPPTILDISIEQATRLEQGIICNRPMVFGISPDFLEGECMAVGYQHSANGMNCYTYRAIPDDTGYEKTLDWCRSYGAKAHDKVDFGDMPEAAPEEPSVVAPPPPKLLGPDGRPMGSLGE